MTNSILLGVIADDPVEAIALAAMLARLGMKTIHVTGVPPERTDYGDAQAVVIALAARGVAPDEAVAMALASAMALREAGAEQVLFNVSVTSGDTLPDHVGPVALALMDFLEVPLAVASPAFPATGRTVYQGHLFVGSALVSDAGGADAHTSTVDANLVRALQAQTSARVGLIPLDIVSAGPEAIKALLFRAQQAGFRLMIGDAVRDADLRVLGQAMSGAQLVLGGLGMAMSLPDNFRRQGRAGLAPPPERMAAPKGRSVILAGVGTSGLEAQVQAAIAAGVPALELEPADIAAGRQVVADVANWVLKQSAKGPVLIYSSDAADMAEALQSPPDPARANLLVEQLLVNLAVILRDNGFSRFIVVGGESSSAIVSALGVSIVEIGPELAPGVPWMRSLGHPDLALGRIAGDDGKADMLVKAWDLLDA